MSLLLKIQNKINNNNNKFNKNINNNIAINKKYNNNNNNTIIEKNKRKKNRINSQSSSLNSIENSNKISELSEDSLSTDNYRYLKGLHIDESNFQSPIINKINIFI